MAELLGTDLSWTLPLAERTRQRRTDKLFSQIPPGPMEAALHSGFGDAQTFRGSSCREALQIPQGQNFSVARRQGHQYPCELAQQEDAIGVESRGTLVPNPQRSHQRRILAKVGKGFDALPLDDLETPGGQGLGHAESRDSGGQDEKGFLNGVEYLGGWAKPAGEPANPRPPKPDHGFEGQRVPGDSTPDELEFFFGRNAVLLTSGRSSRSVSPRAASFRQRRMRGTTRQALSHPNPTPRRSQPNQPQLADRRPKSRQTPRFPNRPPIALDAPIREYSCSNSYGSPSLFALESKCASGSKGFGRISENCEILREAPTGSRWFQNRRAQARGRFDRRP